MRLLLGFTILFFASAEAHGSSGARVATELSVGYVGGAVGGFGVGWLTSELQGEDGSLMLPIVTGTAGAFVGTVSGTYLTGWAWDGDNRGLLGSTSLGVFTGMLVCAAAVISMERAQLPRWTKAVVLALATALPAAGGTIGYELTRKGQPTRAPTMMTLAFTF